MNIKEIAHRAAHSTVPATWLEGDYESRLIAFAEALLAEVQRQNVAVATVCVYENGSRAISYSDRGIYKLENGTLLYPFPPSLESEREKVAEACAAYVDRFIGGDGILNEVWISDIAEAIRSGEWRRFVK